MVWRLPLLPGLACLWYQVKQLLLGAGCGRWPSWGGWGNPHPWPASTFSRKESEWEGVGPSSEEGFLLRSEQSPIQSVPKRQLALGKREAEEAVVMGQALGVAGGGGRVENVGAAAGTSTAWAGLGSCMLAVCRAISCKGMEGGVGDTSA